MDRSSSLVGIITSGLLEREDSLVSGLAAAYGMSIYAVNLTEMNDRTLKAAIDEVPEASVILFEDINCMQAGHGPR